MRLKEKYEVKENPAETFAINLVAIACKVNDIIEESDTYEEAAMEFYKQSHEQEILFTIAMHMSMVSGKIERILKDLGIEG